MEITATNEVDLMAALSAYADMVRAMFGVEVDVPEGEHRDAC